MLTAMPHGSSTTGPGLPRTPSSMSIIILAGQERPAIPAHLLEPPAGMGDAVEVCGGWLWDPQELGKSCHMSHIRSSESYGDSIGGYSIGIHPAPPLIPSSSEHRG